MQGLAAAGACSSFRAFLGFSSARLRPGLGVAAVDLRKVSEGLDAGGAWRSRRSSEGLGEAGKGEGVGSAGKGAKGERGRRRRPPGGSTRPRRGAMI